jgi:hypothetical protein
MFDCSSEEDPSTDSVEDLCSSEEEGDNDVEIVGSSSSSEDDSSNDEASASSSSKEFSESDHDDDADDSEDENESAKSADEGEPSDEVELSEDSGPSSSDEEDIEKVQNSPKVKGAPKPSSSDMSDGPQDSSHNSDNDAPPPFDYNKAESNPPFNYGTGDSTANKVSFSMQLLSGHSQCEEVVVIVTRIGNIDKPFAYTNPSTTSCGAVAFYLTQYLKASEGDIRVNYTTARDPDTGNALLATNPNYPQKSLVIAIPANRFTSAQIFKSVKNAICAHHQAPEYYKFLASSGNSHFVKLFGPQLPETERTTNVESQQKIAKEMIFHEKILSYNIATLNILFDAKAKAFVGEAFFY